MQKSPGAPKRRSDAAAKKAEKVETVEPDPRPLAKRTPPPDGIYQNVKLHLPVWYIERIDEEARYLGYGRRAAFLSLLVSAYAGRVTAIRDQKLPKVKRPTPAELERVQMYMWHCPTETRELLDRLIAEAGGVSPRAWFTNVMNEWLGLPLVPRLPRKKDE
jgi:hypothetical protein